MPSLTHEALLLLFRNRPELAAELLRESLGVELPVYTEVRIESANVNEIVPAEYAADLVVLLVADKPVLAIVLEVQLARNRRKRFTWPMYGTGLRARFECEVIVLVVVPNDRLAHWAARPIRIGPGSVIQPLVLGPVAVPVVVDPMRAQAEPELAVLSVMAHGRGNVQLSVQIALAASAGVGRIADPERFVLYSDLIQAALSDAARKAFQMLPEGYEFQSETVRKSIEKGRSEGLVVGRSEGLVVGRSEGLVAGRSEGRLAEKAADVLDVLDARGLGLRPEQRDRILGCTDLETLRQWLRRAATVASTDELFV